MFKWDTIRFDLRHFFFRFGTNFNLTSSDSHSLDQRTRSLMYVNFQLVVHRETNEIEVVPILIRFIRHIKGLKDDTAPFDLNFLLSVFKVGHLIVVTWTRVSLSVFPSFCCWLNKFVFDDMNYKF